MDDDAIPLPDEPIDLSKTLHQIPTQPVTSTTNSRKNSADKSSDLVKELINELEEDEDDKEFEALAAESLNKEPVVITSLPITAIPLAAEVCFDAFENEYVIYLYFFKIFFINENIGNIAEKQKNLSKNHQLI